MSEPASSALFSDGKAADAFRTIGEVAKALGIRQHVLRYWEEQIPALSPVKRSGGRRYYRPEDVALVQTIDRLVHREGYTLRGARLALEGGVDAVPPAITDRIPAAVPDMLGRLKAIRNELAAALQAPIDIGSGRCRPKQQIR
jgi:DNA-binding transcriptional MerR regulator